MNVWVTIFWHNNINKSYHPKQLKCLLRYIYIYILYIIVPSVPSLAYCNNEIIRHNILLSKNALNEIQNVLRWIARTPSSSNSLLLTHIFLKVSKEARIEPPIQVLYNRSWGADICHHRTYITHNTYFLLNP